MIGYQCELHYNLHTQTKIYFSKSSNAKISIKKDSLKESQQCLENLIYSLRIANNNYITTGGSRIFQREKVHGRVAGTLGL